MTRLMTVAWVWLLGLPGLIGRVRQRRTDRGAAVEWLIVVGAAVGIAYFAGDAVLSFAKSVAAKLGQ